MRKRIRLVLIEDDSSDVEGVLADARTHYPDDRHQFGRQALFILTSDLTSTVAAKLGLDGADENGGRSGTVLTIDAGNSGYASNDFWEWITEAEVAVAAATT